MDFLLKPLIAKFEKKLELISNDLDFLCNRVQEIDVKLTNLLTTPRRLRSPCHKPTDKPPNPPSKSSKVHDESNSQSHSIKSTGKPQGCLEELVSA